MAKKIDLAFQDIAKKEQYFIYKKPLFKPNMAYLDIRRCIKYFPNAIMHIVYGTGGAGKTTTCRKFLLAQYKKQIEEIESKTWEAKYLLNKEIKINDKFLWLNRTDAEIKAKQKDIFKDFGWICMGKNNEIQKLVELNVINNGKEQKMVYALTLGKYEALNNSSKIRGGNSFEDYTIFIWDEFMDEKGNDLPEEMKRLQSILMTAMRSKKNTKIFLLSNSVSKECSLFDMFNFDPRLLKANEQMYYPKKRIAFYYVCPSDGLMKEYETSDYMTLFGETQYTSYRFGGEFNGDDDTFILKKPEVGYPLKFKFHVKILNNYLSVYEYKDGLFFKDRVLLKDSGEIDGKTYPLTKADAINEGISWTGGEKLALYFYRMLRMNKIYFENQMIRELIFIFISSNYKNKSV